MPRCWRSIYATTLQPDQVSEKMKSKQSDITFNLHNFSYFSKRFKYYRDAQKVSVEEMQELAQLTTRKDVTLEEEFEKIKEMDIDNWEQVRGPRPWEEREQMPPPGNAKKMKKVFD